MQDLNNVLDRPTSGRINPLLHNVRKLRRKGAVFQTRLWRLAKSPLFVWLTIVFHSIVVGSAFCIQEIELPSNPKFADVFTALYWAVSTVTTVGYGDVVPVTTMGKILAIGLMIAGPIFSAIYTALFASALLAPEIEDVERNVHGVQTQFRALEREVRGDDAHIEAVLKDLQSALNSLQRKSSLGD